MNEGRTPEKIRYTLASPHEIKGMWLALIAIYRQLECLQLSMHIVYPIKVIHLESKPTNLSSRPRLRTLQDFAEDSYLRKV